MAIYTECGHVVVANEKECSQCLGKRALAWIRQYALQALREAADDDSLACSTSAAIALAHLPEGVRLPKEE